MRTENNVPKMALTDKVSHLCEEYFFWGRRITNLTSKEKESTLLCFLRMLSWATGFVPAFFGSLYVGSQLLQYTHPRYDWKETLIASDVSKLADMLTSKDIELYDSAFSKLPRNPTIKKVFIYSIGSSQSLAVFKDDNAPVLEKAFDESFQVMEDNEAVKTKAHLKCGGKAVLIIDAPGIEGFSSASFVDYFVTQNSKLGQYLRGGNLVYVMKSRHFKQVWIDLFGILPPQLRRILITGKQS